MGATRVFLVDDHAPGLRLLQHALDGDPRLAVVGTAKTFGSARAAIPATLVDVAVVDDVLPDGYGVDLCRFLHEECHAIATILYAVTDWPGMRDRAMRAGASAVVLKSVDLSKLVSTILSVDRSAAR